MKLNKTTDGQQHAGGGGWRKPINEISNTRQKKIQ